MISLQMDMDWNIVCYVKLHWYEVLMTLKIFLQMLVFFVYIFLCSPKLNYQKFTIILINIWTITGGIFRSILFEPIFGKNSL